MPDHITGTRQEFETAREQLLAEEKELTHRGDKLAQKRRELPWVPIEKDYRLETDEGTKSLAELFDGRSQLLIYHFMFGPTYQGGCPTCSSMADGMNGLLPHLHARDLTLAFVSRAPLDELQAYKQRMGWSIPWFSSVNSDFSLDLGASLTPEQTRAVMPPSEDDMPPIARQGAAATHTDLVDYISEVPSASVFMLEDGVVYQTYWTTWRGVEFLMGFYPVLDRIPKGRDEGEGFQLWIRRHDEYGVAEEAAAR
jgi:predicted dithiol-disulfide oxidoreductase (DUF899 family)